MSPKQQLIGWREWLMLPALGIPAIKAKIDTGARTSALHAFQIEPYRQDGIHKIRFAIHPLRKRDDLVIRCHAEIVDQRIVSDSGGHRERRYVITSPVRLGEHEWPIELTLTDRENMLFRMLLGRTALEKGFIVDPHCSYYFGRSLRRIYRTAKKPKEAN